MNNVLWKSKIFNRLFTDESLTKRATLNAISSSLDYTAQLAVSLIITPFMVGGLGNYFYGAWQTINRVVGYLSPTLGNPTQTLRWTLANQQASVDYEIKRRYIGSAITVWLIFLPILIIGGGLLAWFIPYWLKTPTTYIWQIRIATLILVLNLVMINFATLPRSVLEGENLGYKRIGLAAMVTLLGGFFVWLVIYFHKGIVGLAAVAFFVSLLLGIFYLKVARSNVTWFGINRPAYQEIRGFLNLSIWFIAWDIVTKLMVVSDVVILALINSVEAVTPYTLTKHAPETVISFIGIMVFSIVPGLGGIIGSGQISKAAHIRGEIMSLTWLISATLGTVILIWNKVFIHLWIGDSQFAGALENLLMILVVFQVVLIKNDACIIDLTLRIQSKVIIGALSIILSILAASIFVGYFQLGIVGLCLGLILGRLMMSIVYPTLTGRFLEVSLFSQIKSSIRPLMVTIMFFGGAFLLDNFHFERYFSGFLGWLLFLSMAGITAILCLLVLFFAGFTHQQRKNIWYRVKYMISMTGV